MFAHHKGTAFFRETVIFTALFEVGNFSYIYLGYINKAFNRKVYMDSNRP